MLWVALPNGERSPLGDGSGTRREPRSVQHGPSRAVGALGLGGVASGETGDRDRIARIGELVSDGRMGYDRTKQVGHGNNTYMSESHVIGSDSTRYDTHGY